MTVSELFSQGGWAMYPIYACSFVALAVFVHKLLEMRAARLADVTWLEPTLARVRAGDFDGAREACRRPVHPAARVVTAAIDTLERRPARAEAEAYRVGGLHLQKLEQNLSLLSFIATVAPLLGLLGTVLGMVDLFMGLQGSGLGGLDASKLSSGIWKALLTTAAGLLVAVPAMAAHAYLTSRTDRLRLQMSDAIQRVLTEAPVEPAATGDGADAPPADDGDERAEVSVPRRVRDAV